MNRFRQFTAILTGIVALGIASSDGATIYVDAANPTPPGDGSAGNPFTTITNAVVALAASNAVSQGGHVISVAPGAYTAEVVFTNDHSGGTSPNILLAPSGGVTNSGQAITFINASNLVVSGFVVTKAPSAGILLTGTDPGESDNVTVRYTTGRGSATAFSPTTGPTALWSTTSREMPARCITASSTTPWATTTVWTRP